MMAPEKPEDLPDPSELEILQWYANVGVDIALEEEPVNQFEITKAEIAAKVSTVSKLAGNSSPTAVANHANPSAQMLTIPDEKAISSAKELAESAKSLDELRAKLENFQGCNLRRGAKNLVFGEGKTGARVMFVGETPGRDEDLHGLPLVGPTGQLFDKMIKAIGLDRDQIYFANILPWRPPGNRTPTSHETEICRPFIQRQIELVAPNILVCLGGASAKTLLGGNEGILRTRGRWKNYISESHANTSEIKLEIDCLVTFHPSYLLKQPAQKKLAWQDLLKLKAKLSA